MILLGTLSLGAGADLPLLSLSQIGWTLVGNRPGVEHDRIGTSILARDLRRYATPRASARSSFGVGLRRTSRPCFIRHRTRHPVGVTYSRRLAPPSAQSWSLDTQARV